MKTDTHSEYLNTRTVLKLALGAILTEFQGLSSSITLNIITLPNSGKSVVVKTYPKTLYFISARSVVHKSDVFFSGSHEILKELFLSVKS